MSEYTRLVEALDHDRWHQHGVIADWCEDNGFLDLAKGWRWIAKHKRWPSKHRRQQLWAWYAVPGLNWAARRQDGIPIVLIGGSKVYTEGRRTGRREGVKYFRHVFMRSESECFRALAAGVAQAIVDGVLEE